MELIRRSIMGSTWQPLRKSAHRERCAPPGEWSPVDAVDCYKTTHEYERDPTSKTWRIARR